MSQVTHISTGPGAQHHSRLALSERDAQALVELARELNLLLARVLGPVDQRAKAHALDSRPINRTIPPASVLSEIMQLRLRRSKFFPSDLFADPAWDMLLFLYDAHLGQRQECVSNVCLAANVPQTTALRWLHKLLKINLIELEPDRFDHRRKYASLSAAGVDAMRSFFESARSAVTIL